jgi:hypothetical protein
MRIPEVPDDNDDSVVPFSHPEFHEQEEVDNESDDDRDKPISLDQLHVRFASITREIEAVLDNADKAALRIQAAFVRVKREFPNDPRTEILGTIIDTFFAGQKSRSAITRATEDVILESLRHRRRQWKVSAAFPVVGLIIIVIGVLMLLRIFVDPKASTNEALPLIFVGLCVAFAAPGAVKLKELISGLISQGQTK